MEQLTEFVKEIQPFDLYHKTYLNITFILSIILNIVGIVFFTKINIEKNISYSYRPDNDYILFYLVELFIIVVIWPIGVMLVTLLTYGVLLHISLFIIIMNTIHTSGKEIITWCSNIIKYITFYKSPPDISKYKNKLLQL